MRRCNPTARREANEIVAGIERTPDLRDQFARQQACSLHRRIATRLTRERDQKLRPGQSGDERIAITHRLDKARKANGDPSEHRIANHAAISGIDPVEFAEADQDGHRPAIRCLRLIKPTNRPLPIGKPRHRVAISQIGAAARVQFLDLAAKALGIWIEMLNKPPPGMPRQFMRKSRRHEVIDGLPDCGDSPGPIRPMQRPHKITDRPATMINTRRHSAQQIGQGGAHRQHPLCSIPTPEHRIAALHGVTVLDSREVADQALSQLVRA